MDLHVTRRAIVVLRILIVLWTSRFNRAYVVGQAMAREAKLIHGAVFQQPRIGRPVRRVTGGATFRLYRRVLISKWTLLVYVTFNARSVGSRSKSRLLGFESAVRVVTIAAAHGPFQNFVMERHRELRLNFVVTTGAELRIVGLQHSHCREAGLFGIRGRRQHV